MAQSTPHAIAVYASQPLSPAAAGVPTHAIPQAGSRHCRERATSEPVDDYAMFVVVRVKSNVSRPKEPTTIDQFGRSDLDPEAASPI